MRNFFKIFFATLLALIIFSILAFFFFAVLIGQATKHEKTPVGNNGILVLDLSTSYPEQAKDDALAKLTGDASGNTPGIYDIVRMLHYAKYDSSIKGLYIKAETNPNGFAATQELREAVLDFKQSKKFVIAYGEGITQKAYYVATAADGIYCNPAGGLEWDGFNATTLFIKGLLDKLEVEPQVFYAGKYKSFTELFRTTQMTPPNRLQTSIWLSDLYSRFLTTVSTARGIDTATLHTLANNAFIQTANDALRYKLLDGVKYDDEIKSLFFAKLHAREKDKLNFVSLGKYADAVDFKNSSGNDKIAVIYAEGDIVDGKGTDEEIGSDKFRNLIRKVRMDDDIKAIVLRINSPGGSSLASDVLLREVQKAKETKPVVISMGDYAASGGYYMICAGDSVFADPGTITGSIGVFTVLPNMKGLLNNKLGITFDGVKTAPYADMPSNVRPLTDFEKKLIQTGVDTTYQRFLSHVSAGRNKPVADVDSIAQGRVWTGERAIQIGLVDRIGSLQKAVECAARMAKTNSYKLREYPEPKSFLEQLLSGSVTNVVKENKMEKEIGTEQYSFLKYLKQVKEMFGTTQARLPFKFDMH